MKKRTFRIEFNSNLSDGEASDVASDLAPDVLTALEVCADSYGKSVKAVKVYDARESTPSRRVFKVEFSSDLSDGEASDVASDLAPDVRKTLEVCADSYGRSVGAVKVYDAQR